MVSGTGGPGSLSHPSGLQARAEVSHGPGDQPAGGGPSPLGASAPCPQTRSDGVSWSPASSVPGTAPKADGLRGARILGPIRWRVGPQGHVRRPAGLRRLTAGLSSTVDLAGLGEGWMASSWGCGPLPRAHSRHRTPVPGVLPGGPLPWRLLQPTSWTKAAKTAPAVPSDSFSCQVSYGSAEHLGGGDAVVERLGLLWDRLASQDTAPLSPLAPVTGKICQGFI